jgi:hypothetical protein
MTRRIGPLATALRATVALGLMAAATPRSRSASPDLGGTPSTAW